MNLTKIDLGEAYARKIRMRQCLYENRCPLPIQERLLTATKRYSYHGLVAATLSRDLSFEEAFVAMCYAVRASNASIELGVLAELPTFGKVGDLMAAREMLSGLAMKEAKQYLTADEVAGLVTAAMLDVVRLSDYGRRVIENCGMGGDRGICINGEQRNRKTINSSTLSALVLASLGIQTAKHGSYSNTSVVGSTDAIEKLGVVVDIPSIEAQNELIRTGFHYTDAHAWKTIHDLSHVQPRRETVNHIIGPMTPPIGCGTRLDKILGVNEKLHPSVVARAYEILNQQGVINIGNVAVVCGLDRQIKETDIDNADAVRSAAILDELSPFASVVSFVQREKFVGTFTLMPDDFGLRFIDPYNIFVLNTNEDIMTANRIAISGNDDGRQLVEYLAMNAALGLYMVDFMDDDTTLGTIGPSREALRHCYDRCLVALREKRVKSYLDSYVDATRRLTAQYR